MKSLGQTARFLIEILFSDPEHWMQRRMISVVIFFVFLRLLFFCFVVAICDLVHAVEAMYCLP